MERPLFSCVIPVKGERPFLERALESLRSQGMGDELEIIVQDADVEPDKGQSDALNKGFGKAKGEWLFWLNADDVLLPGSLGRVRDLINAGRFATRRIRPCWIVGDEVFIDSDSRVVDASVGNTFHRWLYRHAVPHVHGPSAFFRRELFDKVGGFDESLNICMDWDLWIRFMKAGARQVRVPEFLWAQRRWEGSKTQRIGGVKGEELKRHREEIERMLKKNDFEITWWGVWKLRIWRMLSGCYLKEFIIKRKERKIAASSKNRRFLASLGGFCEQSADSSDNGFCESVAHLSS